MEPVVAGVSHGTVKAGGRGGGGGTTEQRQRWQQGGNSAQQMLTKQVPGSTAERSIKKTSLPS